MLQINIRLYSTVHMFHSSVLNRQTSVICQTAILRKTAASAVRNVRELLRSLPLTLNLLLKGQNI